MCGICVANRALWGINRVGNSGVPMASLSQGRVGGYGCVVLNAPLFCREISCDFISCLLDLALASHGDAQDGRDDFEYVVHHRFPWFM